MGGYRRSCWSSAQRRTPPSGRERVREEWRTVVCGVRKKKNRPEDPGLSRMPVMLAGRFLTGV